MTKQEERDFNRHMATLELGSENVKVLVQALDILGQAKIGYGACGRRAISGLCYAIDMALTDMDRADHKLHD